LRIILARAGEFQHSLSSSIRDMNLINQPLMNFEIISEV